MILIRQKAVLLAYILNYNDFKLEQTMEVPHYNPKTTMKLWVCSQNLNNKFTVCHHIFYCSTTNALELALSCP
jgi:lipid A disaccharide synthetase